MNVKITRRKFVKSASVALPIIVGRKIVDADAITYAGSNPQRLVLWYEKPATQWLEALPVGNGRLGAMVFGGTASERLQLNEDTLYAGGPYDPNNREALAALPEARRLIFEGKCKEASDLVGAKMMAQPIKQMPYEPVWDFKLEFPGHLEFRNYRRELDLETAIARVSYSSGDLNFTREVFVSPVDQVIVIHLRCDHSGQITFVASLATSQKAVVTMAGSDTLVMSGENGEASGVKGALRFDARVVVQAHRGKTVIEKERIAVINADSATVLIAAATSYKNYKDISGDPENLTKAHLKAAYGKAFEKLRADHIREHQRLFNRVRLDLGTTEAAGLPTDQRPAKFLEGVDPHLATLYFQYGRYLLISSSRAGTQPANLQGLWNDSMTPPWESKYTVNINTEMNYWPAETTNLSECHEPLLRMVAELVENGSRTAQIQYGARGWVCHHNTDLWRQTAPIDGAFGLTAERVSARTCGIIMSLPVTESFSPACIR